MLVQIVFLFMKFRMSDQKIKAYFEARSTPVKIERYTVDNRQIRYIATGTDTLPMVIFVHGAPGGLDAFKEFLVDSNLTNKAHLVAVDRPGYGYSGFGKSEPSIQKQAELLKPLLDLNHSGHPAILVGHSYGGPIVARMAMDYPSKVAALVLAAPAIDPKNEKVFWISYPIDYAVLRWMVPPAFRVANDEKLHHAQQLHLLKNDWKKLTLPVTYIHGKKDILVPFANTAFAKKMMVNAQLEVVTEDKMNHFIPWTHPQYIHRAIHKYLAQTL
ncbi:alpha/beta hydrolase superfamily, putative [Microscilla marina ATCC 23134]|uniref:Alpha/beta hydrolase superfamily, putative n=1 Tax=Microscilla marina ATCC 23134 TaxID=313606 RepID=A1ZFS8_MICM2|nr:alpha/beta hydrolase superfamily, putative [Microscilla marina ATCC 23134]